MCGQTFLFQCHSRIPKRGHSSYLWVSFNSFWQFIIIFAISYSSFGLFSVYWLELQTTSSLQWQTYPIHWKHRTTYWIMNWPLQLNYWIQLPTRILPPYKLLFICQSCVILHWSVHVIPMSEYMNKSTVLTALHWYCHICTAAILAIFTLEQYLISLIGAGDVCVCCQIHRSIAIIMIQLQVLNTRASKLTCISASCMHEIIVTDCSPFWI